jgi:sodium/potassium-transporting ATPase subunit alpha
MLPEIIPFVIYIIFNIPLPTGTITLLFIDLATDIVPAITLAYEVPENDIMKRPPRDLNKDTIITQQMIGMTCGQIGIIESIAGMFVYFVLFAHYGFKPWDVIGLRANWDNNAINNLADSYGQEWTFAQRHLVQYTSYTAYLAAVCVVQWANIIVCKTRRVSILEHGMFNNKLHFGLGFMSGFMIFIAFCPGIQNSLNLVTMHWSWFLPAFPFSIAILAYGEGRKLYCRNHPGGFVERELIT